MSHAREDAPKRIREGSSLYYSLLWTSDATRHSFYNRLNLAHTLATTLDDVQEPQVAEKKIHWWHEELQRLRDGSARHPTTKACQPELIDLDSAQAACLDIISVASTQRFTPVDSESASNEALLQSYKARLALLAHALSGNAQDLKTDSHSNLAALAFARYEQLSRLPTLIHRGLPVFSSEIYKRFNTQPTDLAKHILVASTKEDKNEQSAPLSLNQIPIATDNPERQKLLNYAIKQAMETLTSAVNSNEISERYRRNELIPLWRLLVLRKHQVTLWHKKQPDLLRERATLTPLRKFFHAWRHRK